MTAPTRDYLTAREAGISPDELRRRREALGLTQEQLARVLDVTNTTVSRWERGITPMPGRLVELAMAHLACVHAAAEGALPNKAHPGLIS